MDPRERIADYIKSYEQQRSFFGFFPFGKPKSFRYRNLLELQEKTSPPTEYDVFQALIIDRSKSSPRFDGLIDTQCEEHERLNSEKIRMRFIDSLLEIPSNTRHPQPACYNAIIQTVHDSLDQKGFDAYFSLLRSIQRTSPNAPINVETVQSVQQQLIGTLKKNTNLPFVPCLTSLKQAIDEHHTTDFLDSVITKVKETTEISYTDFNDILRSALPDPKQEKSGRAEEKPRSSRPSRSSSQPSKSSSQPSRSSSKSTNYDTATEFMGVDRTLNTIKEEDEDGEGESPN